MHIQYLNYVLRHKWFVFLECCKLGIPWLGIIHDWSRFLPDEWSRYVLAHYDYINTGMVNLTNEFELAWNDHQHRNKHHWEYWVHFDYYTHEMKVLPIPDKYRREMLADWYGAKRARKSNKSVLEWFSENKSRMMLHVETQQWIEVQLFND